MNVSNSYVTDLGHFYRTVSSAPNGEQLAPCKNSKFSAARSRKDVVEAQLVISIGQHVSSIDQRIRVRTSKSLTPSRSHFLRRCFPRGDEYMLDSCSTDRALPTTA
jgi:hypothetical protein